MHKLLKMLPKGAFRLGVYETPVKFVFIFGSYTQDTSLFIYKDFKNMKEAKIMKYFCSLDFGIKGTQSVVWYKHSIACIAHRSLCNIV